VGETIVITVLLWKWKQKNYRSKFTAENVNIMTRMIGRNLDLPHRFLCITDDPEGIECETHPLWDEPNIPLREGRPNCYRRLKVFGEFGKELGDRLLSIDLDTVITGNITPLIDRPEDFVIWGDTAKNTLYNGGFWLMKPGTRTQVWDTFTPMAPRITQKLGIVGSDQAWISHVLGPGEAMWGTKDGVYSYRNHLKHGLLPKPADARIVFFHGAFDPDGDHAQQHRWVRENYR
jgi:hypothetical protein